MKIPKLFKKAAAFVMAAVTALSIMPATAFAAGDIGTIFFSHTYDSNGNAMRYNSSANIGGYTAGGTGNYKYRMFVDGENAFCIQPGVPLKTGNTLKKASSDTWNALSANQKKAVGLALLYGYQGNRNNLSGSDDEKWLATQTLVWEFVTGCREATGSYNQTSTTVYSLHFGSNYANSGARAVYDQIVAMLREHNTIPSFMSGGKNDITKELAYKDGKYSITLTDSNGVLSDYSFSSSDSNVSVSKSGNKLTISSTVAISGSVRITAKRNNVPTVSSSAKLIAYGDPNLQDLVTGVENADTVSAYINIETPTGTIALKKTSEDGVVEGISFTIKGDNFNKTVKTGKDGSVSVEGLFPGTYTVTEQSIDRYEPQKTQTVTLIGGKTSTVTFSNTLKRGSLEIVKTSEDNLVEGMKFHLYGTSLSGLPVDEYAVTDKNGLAKFENVLISGDTPYVVEEVDTAVRYVVPASQTAPIEWNKVTKRSFDNVLKKFQVTVTKTDAETGSPQGDASLAGAVYGIYKGEELIDTYTTDENGQFTTKYYICDNDWTVREISPSEGYLLDTAIHKVGAEPELYTVELNSTANDVNEQVIKGNIALIKHTDNGETQIETPEEGAVFEVFLKSAGSYENAKETERDVLTCDENGFAQTKDMPYGIYTVRQTFGWEGRELMKDFDVFISKDGQTYRYLINNANFESYIKIVKKDAETGNTIPYAGAGFQIYDPNGNLVTMTFTYPEVTTIDTFYTTADGDLITPQTLEYGKGYSLVEVQAPYGYVLNSEPVYFDVVQENSEEESGITVIEVVRSNMAQKGTITVEKSGEVFSSVAGDKGLYQPIFSVSGLEGAVYEITAAEDIVTLDGTIRYTKGQVVATVTTDADGRATTEPLYLGKFTVKEVTAPHGMVLNTNPVDVELTYAGENVKVTTTSTSFYNERQKVTIDLSKSLEKDDVFNIGNDDEITRVQFALYAAEDLTAEDGRTIPKDALIEIEACDTDGKISFKTDLPVGAKEYVKEYATDSHYILSDLIYEVTFDYEGQDTDTVRKNINDGNAIENEMIRGSIVGKKLDEDGFAICGALFGLFAESETEFTEETAILTCESNEIGVFHFENVPFGRWIVREIKAAPAFVLNENSYAVTVSEHEQVVEVTIENEFITGTVKTTKVDKEYPENTLGGAIFEIFVDVDGNQEFDAEIDLLVGEMTETENGIYTMDNLRYNGYFLYEKVAPEGFLKDDGYYYFEIRNDGEIVVVENEAGIGFTNQPIKGNVTTTKVDEEYPENKLTGAKFHIYADTDKNGEFNAEIDTFVVALSETELGVYLAEGVRFGGYFLYEKTAPVGFVKDDTYHYFEIRNDGETIVVENKAGVGFTNKPIVGELELTKTDIADGKPLAGVGFRIKDADGNTVIEGYTDENGIAKFALRYGKYTYSEFDPLDGYVANTDEYPFEITEDGQIVKASVTNEKIPVPDIPQTGDNSNLGFWIGLGAIALGGLIATAVIAIKRKKDDED